MIRNNCLTTRSTCIPTRRTRFPLVVLAFPLVVVVCSNVVHVCPLVVLVCPLLIYVCPLVVLVVLSVGLLRFLKKNNSKITFTRMDLVDENLIIDWEPKNLLRTSKRCFKRKISWCVGLSSWSVGRFCSKRGISSRESTEKVTEIVMEASSKVIFKSLHQKLESLQYNVCLLITGARRSSSREKLYQKLGFESLQQQLWYSRLCSFYKVFKNESPRYFSI